MADPTRSQTLDAQINSSCALQSQQNLICTSESSYENLSNSPMLTSRKQLKHYSSSTVLNIPLEGNSWDKNSALRYLDNCSDAHKNMGIYREPIIRPIVSVYN